MSNVFEIKLDNSTNYVETIKIIKSLGNFTIYNNYFYLDTKYKINKVKSDLKIKDDFIKLINKNNYIDIESSICRNWCYNIILNNVKNDFEKNNQNYLMKLNTDLDFLLELKKEGKLEKYIKNIMQKGGGNINAEEKSETNNNKTSGK